MAMLFEVTIIRTAYVLAETADEAKEMQREIERWEDFPSVEAEPWTGGTLPGWDDKCLVYHGGKGDISLAVAKQMVTPNSAVKSGRLPRPDTQICVDCGDKAKMYDHRSYLKPLEVDPVCQKCNIKRGPAEYELGTATVIHCLSV